jgi:hypothetical protein
LAEQVKNSILLFCSDAVPKETDCGNGRMELCTVSVIAHRTHSADLEHIPAYLS